MGNFYPFGGMVIAVLAQSSNMIVSTKAMSEGLNKYILVVYNNRLACLILLPFCIIKQSYLASRSERPPLNLNILRKFFLLSVFGMERLDLRSSSTQAKIVGTLVSISGAFVVTFYKGPPILNPPSPGLSLNLLGLSEKLRWILGGLFLTADALLGAAWYIMQAFILKKYTVLLLLTFYCSFNAILSALFTLVVVEDTRVWKLHFDMGLAAIIYSAFVNTLLRVSLTAWCVSRCGPLYVTMFKPLGIIFSVVMGFTFLGDVLCSGSLIGAVIIVSGFYAVMWGKANEQKSAEDQTPGILESDSQKVPLLQNKMDNIIVIKDSNYESYTGENMNSQ